MPVLTQQQFKAIEKKVFFPKAEILKSEPITIQPSKTFVLLHPENEQFILKNFEDEVNLKGVKYKRICKNGIVRTKDKILADYLIEQQYRLLKIED